MIPVLPKRGGASWEDRLESLVYTSPSGVSITAQYEKTSEEYEARGTKWEFPGVDGCFIQRTGSSGREYPLRFIFSGSNYDERAKQAMAAFAEPGFGKLQTPIYGKFTAAPLGRITRTDDFVDGANAAIVEVTLYQTLLDLYPTQDKDAEGALAVALEEFNVQAASKFKRGLKVDTVPRKLRTLNTLVKAYKAIQANLKKVARLNNSIRSRFAAGSNLLNSTMSTLIGTPLALAASFISLTQLPGQLSNNLARKLSGYFNMIRDLLGLDGASGTSRIPEEDNNNFYAVDMVASAAVSGMAVSCTTTEFENREEAIRTAITIGDAYQEVLDWREARADELGLIDDAEGHDALQKLVDAAQFLLIESSFSLPTQIQITLTENRGLLELCAELNGSIASDVLDSFIRANRFLGEEILEIPKGREVVYFV